MLLSFTPKKSCTRFWDTLEEAASSWLSAVDMVAARMPARITPAISAGSGPNWLSRVAMRTMMVSLALPSSGATAPTLVIPLPTTPINTATAMEMTTHTVAMRRLTFSLFSSSMAIKRSRMWGIPK